MLQFIIVYVFKFFNISVFRIFMMKFLKMNFEKY